MKEIHTQFIGKTVGIWGFGVGGQSAARFFAGFGCKLLVLDINDAVHEKVTQFSIQGIHFYFDFQKEEFFECSDFVFVSSGVNIQMHYATYKDKYIFELDIFYRFWTKPIIAITGTLGKTSVTTFLSQILQNTGLTVAVGGNIGVGCLDLIAKQESVDLAVLELSSFQLQHSKQFTPSVGIFTNFFPNHLDHHANEQEYFDAKWKIFADPKTHAVVPLSLLNKTQQPEYLCENTTFFSATYPSDVISPPVVYLHADALWLKENGMVSHICNVSDLPPVTFVTNWAIITAALIQWNIDPRQLSNLCATLTSIEHRVEKVATINGVDFYNDSKSTTIQATLAAVHKLQGKPLHLFLGGLSKGVDRSPLIQQLVGKVAFIYCFGKEAAELADLCAIYQIPACAHETLDTAFAHCLETVLPYDQVLLSPAGSSYDLFKNFEERGKCFKKLVLNH